MNTPNLYEYLSKKLEQKRKEYPSFRLMEIDDRLFPNVQTLHSTLVLEARDSNDKLKTVKEIVAESWEKGNKNHLMIEGEGGIGKTVTLLSILLETRLLLLVNNVGCILWEQQNSITRIHLKRKHIATRISL